VTLPPGDGPKTILVEVRDNLDLVRQVSATITLDTTPPDASIRINGGAQYTNTPKVTVEISVSDAGAGLQDMRLSADGGSSWGSWIPYTPWQEVQLPGGDGVKTVVVQVRDKLGFVREVSATITLDQTPPSGSVRINDGAGTTNSEYVTLTLSASDNLSGVAELRISNDNIYWSGWEPAVDSKGWALQPGYGLRHVYVQWRDRAGNVSPVAAASIFLSVDANSPTVQLLINNGSETTTSRDVVLTIQARDNATPPEQLQTRFSNDGKNWTPWEPYQDTRPWSLVPGDGVKTVHVEVRDEHGNVGFASASITLLEGSGSIALTLSANGVPANWNGRSVLVVGQSAQTITVQAPGATELRWRYGNSSWSPWEPFRGYLEVALTPVEGLHRVEVQVRNNTGAISAVKVVDFLLDTTGPVIQASWLNGATATTTGAAVLVVTAKDSLAPASSLTFEYSTDGGITWKSFTGPQVTVALPGKGLKTVMVRARDLAGNEGMVQLSIWSL